MAAGVTLRRIDLTLDAGMAEKQVVLLDGGMGQELVKRGAAKESPVWGAQVLMDSPDLVRELHVEFIKAGAKVITLNSYSVTPERLIRVNAVDQFAELQTRAFELAARARDEAGVADVKIAASLPPLVGSYHPESTPDYEDAIKSYRMIVESQADNVDLYICETMCCIKEAEAAGQAASESDKPYWMAFSVSDECTGALRSEESIGDAYAAIASTSPQAVLLNCSLPEAIDVAWPQAKKTGVPVGAYANGFTSISAMPVGGGVEMLEARTDLGPDEYAAVAMQWVNDSASVIGGCCEISPQHIERLASVLDENGISIVSRLS